MNRMNWEHNSSAAFQTRFPPPGTRVVILDPDGRNRTMLRTPADSATDFAVVLECQTWSDCARVLDEMLPELLIARAELIPPEWSQVLDPNSVFPLVIVIGDDNAKISLASRMIDKMSLPLEPASIKESLTRARHEIFRRKAEELSFLLQHYAEHLAGSSNVRILGVGVGNKLSNLDSANIRYLRADRNYVRIYTDSGSYEIRETISRIVSRLDLSRFVRIHRSVIVNLSYVKDITWTNNVPNAVILEDGTTIGVSPNFRETLRSLTLRKDA